MTDSPVSLDKSIPISLDKEASEQVSTISVGFLAGDVEEIDIEKGSSHSVAALLKMAKIDILEHQDCQIQVDGDVASLEMMVTQGQEVLLVEPLDAN